MGHEDGAAQAPPSTCSRCGRDADGPAVLTWSLTVEGEAWRWTCPECARNHVHEIEGRLEPEWW